MALFLINMGTALAEKQEWFDKQFPFNKVTTVLIYDPQIDAKIKNGIREHEILEAFKGKANLSNVKVITLTDMVNIIKNETGTDLMQLYGTNQQEAIKLLNDYNAKYVDLTISSNVLEYGTGTQYQEGYVYTTTQYQTSYVTGPGGTATVQTPTTQYHNVPGGNRPTAYAAVRWDAYDPKSGKLVMSRIEDRTRVNGSIFGSTQPVDLYKRITESFFNFMNDKIKSDK